MNKQSQYGKGFSGFISGLLLATAVIVGVLFFLNKGDQNVFKDLTRSEKQPEPEVLQPQPTPPVVEKPKVEVTDSGVEGVASEPETISISEPVSETPKPEETVKTEEPVLVPGVPSKKQEPKVQTSREPSEPEVTGEDIIKAEQAEAEKKAAEKRLAEKKAELAKQRADKAKADKAAADKKAADELSQKQKARAERKLAEKKAAEKKAAEKNAAAKPTPEQILNSGSIEKARQAANDGAKQSASKSTEVKKAATSKEVAKDSAKKDTGKKVLVQMGSYSDRNSADAQRAKLAMLGVQSSVVTSTANGKNVYRVQSGVMNQEAAKRVQQTLQKNGVSSFTRSAQ